MPYEFKHYARIGVNTPLYTNIALKNYFEAVRANEEFQSHPKKKIKYIEKDLWLNDGTIIENANTEVTIVNPELNSLRGLIEEKCLVTIVFSHLSIEAFIYDFGAIQLGDKIVSENLDRLDTYSKWVVIPHLVTEKPVDKSQQCFCLLKRLIKTRNKIIHSKSKNYNFDNSKTNIDEDHLECAQNAILTIYKLSEYLKLLTEDEFLGFRFAIGGIPENKLWAEFIQKYC